MTREEMLDKLHSIVAYVNMTGYEFGSLDCHIYTSVGYKHRCFEPGEWPVYKIYGVTMEKIVSLREKASRDKLTPADIEGITLGNLFRSLHQNDDSWDDDELDDEDREYEEREYIETLNHFFKALDGVQTLDPDEECLYAIDDDGSIQFFSEETQVKKAFADSIAVSVTPWETYSDSELEDWLEDIEKIIRDREGFPFTFFD